MLSTPLTISETSLVMFACRALLKLKVNHFTFLLAESLAFFMATILDPCSLAFASKKLS